MRTRGVSSLIRLLALGAIAACGWVMLHRAELPPPNVYGPPRTPILFFSDKMLAGVPGLFGVALWFYAAAAALAAVLALVISARASTAPAPRLLGLALSCLAWFTAHFLFLHRLPGLAGSRLILAGDYPAMAALAIGLWAIVEFSFNYPQSFDVATFQEYAHRLRARSKGTGVGRFQFLVRARHRMERLDEKAVFYSRSMGRGLIGAIRSPWWPWSFALAGCGIVAATHLWGLGAWTDDAFILAMGYPSLLLAGLAYGAFDVQYRMGRAEDRARIAWLALGLVGLTWLFAIPQLGAMMWMAFGGGERAANLMIIDSALAPPAMIVVIVLLLWCSIFFFGAVDPRLAIRKTSVYGLAALLLAVVLAALQGSVAAQLTQRLGLPGGSGPVAAAAVAGLVFAPFRGRIERRVDRLVDRVLPVSTLADAHREQATVVFGDMSGYTELSARDEPSALTLASLLHRESRRLAERHGGRLVKTIGDAVLLAFREPGEALVAALELQEKFASTAAALKLPAMPLHFGVHLGEVVRDQDGDIFGDTVNVAARLQGQAAANEIVASAAVVEAITDGGFRAEPLGDRKLKNVPAPVACFRIS